MAELIQDLKTVYLQRIEELLKLSSDFDNRTRHIWGTAEELYQGTLGIVVGLHGEQSPQARALVESYKNLLAHDEAEVRSTFFSGLKGTLRNLKAEIDQGLTRDIRKESYGEVLGDMAALAKAALSENQIPVASVLTAAALEDGFKRVAQANGLDVGKDMSATINLLKAHGILSGAEAPIAQSFTQFRNKALHADWDKLDAVAVSSAIAFLESFLIKHLS